MAATLRVQVIHRDQPCEFEIRTGVDDAGKTVARVWTIGAKEVHVGTIDSALRCHEDASPPFLYADEILPLIAAKLQRDS
jgi:hypothetical protein